MNQIKFSHFYSKFFSLVKNGSEVMLLQVLKVKYMDLSDEFKVYDTSIWSGGFYELPRTDLLILFFRHDLGIFTTIRRSTSDKERYYQSKVGQQFKVVIDEEEKK